MTKFLTLTLLIAAHLFVVSSVYAQGVTLSVTPTLIDMTAEPSQAWQSNIRVINNNPFELTVYPEVVNFMPQGEYGQGAFYTVPESERTNSTLAEWITISPEPVVIPRESSASIPINLNVSSDAAPGGHYAAIMIGTRPTDGSSGMAVRTSQVVSSLFFVRIAGDIVESGSIRSFRTLHRVAQTPEATFELRFENTGNVHLQPQGSITITNMWGSERGVIPINRQTMFGNVLPDSIRLYEFAWKGAFSLADIGRYTAEVTLGYGQDSKKFSTRTVNFWVIPMKGVALVLLVLILFIVVLRYAIRSYVDRMLTLAGVDPRMGKRVKVPASKLAHKADVRIQRTTTYVAPVTAGYQDLLEQLGNVSNPKDWLYGLAGFAYQYRRFFILVFTFLCIILLALSFWAIVKNEAVPFEITFNRNGEDVTVSSDQILYDADTRAPAVSSDGVVSSEADSVYQLVITNASGVSGVTAELRKQLESEGEVVSELRSDLTEINKRTVIIYTPDLESEALRLSARLDNALLSAVAESSDIQSFINIIVGADFLQ